MSARSAKPSVLRSMTGYGAASREEEGLRIGCEVRTVNHRHLNLKLRLPAELASLEADVDAAVKKRLARGSVGLTVSLEGDRAVAAAAIDQELAARYRDDLARVAGELGLSAEVSLETLLGLPGVVAAAEPEPREAESLRGIVLRTVDEALLSCVEMRATEGRAIRADLEKHAAATGTLVGRIEKRMPTVVKGHQKTLAKRVDELLGDRRVVEPGDLAREVALLADRLDVSEEIARLASHLEQLDSFLAKGGTVGRKLDFLVQEIFREVNTIGSKCCDAKVAHWVVEAKTHVERLREQVQNVE